MHRNESFTAFVDREGGRGLVAHSAVHLVTPIPLMARFEGTAQWPRTHSDDRRALAVSGAVHLTRLQAEVVFRRRRTPGAPRAEERRSSTVVVPGDLALPIPAQFFDVEVLGLLERAPSLCHAPHVPRIDTTAPDSRAETSPLCAPVVLDATLDAHFTPRERWWSREIVVEFFGEIRFDRTVRAGLGFTPRPAADEAPFTPAEVVLVTAGTRLPIPHRAVTGLFVPNPWISVRFLDARGGLAVKEHDLGRSARVT